MKTNIIFSILIVLFSINVLSAQVINNRKTTTYPKDGRKPSIPINSGVSVSNEVSQGYSVVLFQISLQIRIKLPHSWQIMPWIINPKDIKIKIFETKTNRNPDAFFETCQYAEITNFEIAKIDLIKPKTESEPWGVVYFIKGLNSTAEYSTQVSIDALKPANANQRIDASGMALAPSALCGNRGKVATQPIEVGFKVVSK